MHLVVGINLLYLLHGNNLRLFLVYLAYIFYYRDP